MDSLDSPASQIFLLEKYKFILTERGTLYKSMMKVGRTINDSTVRYIARSREGVILPEETVIKVDSEITQVVQGRDHILILDSSGKVYGLGDNSFFQVCPIEQREYLNAGAYLISATGTKGGVLTTKVGKQSSDQLSNNSPTNTVGKEAFKLGPQGSQELKSPDHRKSVEPRGTISPRGSVNIIGPPVLPISSEGNMHQKVSVFVPEPIKVQFPGLEGRAIARIHAFGNTSLAYDRIGNMYLWGENLVTQEQNLPFGEGKCLRYPTQIKRLGPHRITENQDVVILDRISGAKAGREMFEDKTLTLLRNYKGQNELEMVKLRPLMETLAFKIHQNSEQQSIKAGSIDDIVTKIDQLEAKIARNKQDPNREEMMKESKKLKERKAAMESEKKKVDTDLKDAQTRLLQSRQDDKTASERTKILEALIEIHKQTKREKEALTAVNQVKLLLDSIHRRFGDIDKMQVCRVIQSENTRASDAFAKVVQNIELENVVAQEELHKNMSQEKPDTALIHYLEMYQTALNVLSLQNRLQFSEVQEAQRRVVESNAEILLEQNDPTTLAAAVREKPVFRNLDHLAHKIFNFKFTNKQ